MSSAEPQPPDQTLLRRALEGDVSAFGALVERHFGPVYAVALARLRDPEAAEDLAQEVFLRAQIHLQRLGPSGSFAGWVVRIARNLAIDWLRRRQTASRLLPMVDLGERTGEIPDTSKQGVRDAMAGDEEHSAVRRAILDLPDNLREVVLLHWTEALTQQEVADRLGLNQATVSRRLQRALKALRGTLEPVLREAAPTLRPAPRALAKSLAITVAVGALSGTAKAALVTAAPVSQISSATQAAQMGAVGTVGVIGFFKSLPALVAGGAKAMATGKGIAVTVAAVGAVSVGTYHFTHSGSDSGAISGQIDTPLPSFTNSLGMRMIEILEGEYEMGLSRGERQTLARRAVEELSGPIRREADSWIEGGMPMAAFGRDQFRLGLPDEIRIELMELAMDARRSDSPPHTATLDAIHMSETEVTVEQYLRFVEASGHRPPPDNRYKPHAENPHTPITNVTWNDAMAFCVWLSETEGGTYCLPTEAEWEGACRAGTTTLFAFGDTLESNEAHFSHEIHGAGPLDVGSFPPNAWGLRDMHGNVSEWCLDYHSEDFYSDPRATQRNPVNDQPERGRPEHVNRGGGWVDISDVAPAAMLCRSSFRGPGFDSDFRADDLGFRVVWFDAEPNEIRGAEMLQAAFQTARASFNRPRLARFEGSVPDLHTVTLQSEEVHEGISWRFLSFTEGVLTLPVQPEQVDLVLYFDGNDCSQGALLGNDDRLSFLYPIGHRPWSELATLSPPAQDVESVVGIMPLTREQEGLVFWVRTVRGEYFLVRIEAVRPATYSDLVSGETAEVDLQWWRPQIPSE